MPPLTRVYKTTHPKTKEIMKEEMMYDDEYLERGTRTSSQNLMGYVHIINVLLRQEACENCCK